MVFRHIGLVLVLLASCLASSSRPAYISHLPFGSGRQQALSVTVCCIAFEHVLVHAHSATPNARHRTVLLTHFANIRPPSQLVRQSSAAMEDWDGCELLSLWRAAPSQVSPAGPSPVAQPSRSEPEHHSWDVPPHYVRNWEEISVLTLPVDYDDEEITWDGKTASQWVDEWPLHNPQCRDPECVGCDVPGLPQIRYDYRGIVRFAFLPPSSSSSRTLSRARTPSPDVVLIPSPHGPHQRRTVPSAQPHDKHADKRQRADSGCVRMHLSAAKTAGLVTSHCLRHVNTVIEAPVNFKIGLAYNPEHRWSNTRYGYATGNMYHVMDVIAELDTADGAAYLEATLIERYKNRSGCMNRAPGGEGLRGHATNGPYYVYIVHGPRQFASA